LGLNPFKTPENRKNTWRTTHFRLGGLILLRCVKKVPIVSEDQCLELGLLTRVHAISVSKMKKTRYLGLLILVVFSACRPVRLPPPLALDSSPQGVLNKLANDFISRVEQTGIELPYRPELWEWTRPGLISWREDLRSVAVPRFSELDQKTTELFTRLGGLPFFNLAFRWFLPIHELAYFLQTEFDFQGTPAQAERLANNLAVAFFMTQPGGRDKLTTLGAYIEEATKHCCQPALAQDGIDSYFDENNDLLSLDPMAYRAFCWRFLQDSLKQIDSLDFSELVRQMTGQSRLPTAVMLDAALDVGFHVAAHLLLPDVAITLFDPIYIQRVRTARKNVMIPDLLLQTQRGLLSRKLNILWQTHRLVRVPAFFHDFDKTKTAFKLLLGEVEVSKKNQHIQNRLDTHFLSQYPAFKKLSPSGQLLGQALAAVIEYEYESFYKTFHSSHRQKWDWSRRKFKKRWYAEIVPAIAALDPGRSIKQAVVVLSPALRRHGKSYRIQNSIARVATLLPENPEEMIHALLYAFHEMCHGISDRLIYELGYHPQQVSYKKGDKGKSLHILIEAAANQAMFDSLTKTNPELLESFLTTFGNLAWLGEQDLLMKHTLLAGRNLSADLLQQLQKDLENNSREGSRQIYTQGLLVPEKALVRLRKILTGNP
jgi:hypothetical protein